MARHALAGLSYILVGGLLLACGARSAPLAEPPVRASTPTTAPVVVGAAPGAVSRPAPVAVSVGVLAVSAQAPFAIAEARGYFAEEGLEVELQRFDSGARMVAPLAAGQLQAGMGSHSAGLFNALATGIGLKIVASNQFNTAGRSPSAIVVRRDLYDAGFRSGPEIRGKTIAVTAFGTTVHANAGRYLEKFGIAPDEVHIVELSQPDMNVALANGGIDLANQSEPLVTLGAEQGILVRLHGIDEIYPDRESSVILYGQQFIDEQPEAARRLMVAYLRAVRDFEDAFRKQRDRAAVLAILTERLPIRDPALWLRMYEQGTLLYINPDGRANAESIAWDQEWMLRLGLVRQRVDMAQVIDHRFVDYAVQRLGPYQP
ncbi:MAG TPA: ABC transporter substrate-binding protein [Chloroflexota bacterium]|jgi:NitT/TauT family transport system substrate-binding protein|nr:ABC transporter substrate-binding protein [Chloroflexota bacterium]